MADTNGNGKIEYDEPSRLSTSSEDFRTCALKRNSPSQSIKVWGGYVDGNEYCEGSNWIKNTDDDGKGRDPKDGDLLNAGTAIDVTTRENSLKKNTPSKSDDNWTGYNRAHPYNSGTA